MSLYPFNHQRQDANFSVFEDQIDLQEIYENGFFATKISRPFRVSMLAATKKVKFTPYIMDSIDHGDASECDLVINGFPPAYQVVLDSILAQCAPVLSLFHNKRTPVAGEIGILKLSKGYYIDWHQDSFSQGVLYFAAILNEVDFEEGEGGTLQFAKVKFDENGNISEREIQREFPANNSGQIVFFDPCNLNFQHRCTEIKADKTRFLFFGSIGEIM